VSNGPNTTKPTQLYAWNGGTHRCFLICLHFEQRLLESLGVFFESLLVDLGAVLGCVLVVWVNGLSSGHEARRAWSGRLIVVQEDCVALGAGQPREMTVLNW